MDDGVRRSVEDFVQRVRASREGHRLAKAVIFGSVARGAGHAGSDVDVLLVGAGVDRLRDVVAEAAFEAQMERGLPIEPVLVPLDEACPPASYFVDHALRTGTEVFSMSSDELKALAATDLRGLAQEYADAARDALASGRFRLAADAAYNAVELHLKALILRERDDLPGSHGGVVGVFGELYVKSGKVDRAVGRDVNRALELRNAARYKPSATVSREDAESVIALVATVEKIP